MLDVDGLDLAVEQEIVSFVEEARLQILEEERDSLGRNGGADDQLAGSPVPAARSAGGRRAPRAFAGPVLTARVGPQGRWA